MGVVRSEVPRTGVCGGMYGYSSLGASASSLLVADACPPRLRARGLRLWVVRGAWGGWGDRRRT